MDELLSSSDLSVPVASGAAAAEALSLRLLLFELGVDVPRVGTTDAALRAADEAGRRAACTAVIEAPHAIEEADIFCRKLEKKVALICFVLCGGSDAPDGVDAEVLFGWTRRRRARTLPSRRVDCNGAGP